MVIKLPRHMLYYDMRKGWMNDKPNWYHAKVYNQLYDFISFQEHCLEIIDWLYSELDMPERHCRWTYDCDKIEVKFRYQQHYQWFTLRWC